MYFILAVGGDQVKIGLSDNPAERLAQLQVGNAYPLSLLGAIRANASKEKELHRQLAAHAMSGEWFRFSCVEKEIGALLKKRSGTQNARTE